MTFDNSDHPANINCFICGKKVSPGKAKIAITNGIEIYNIDCIADRFKSFPNGFYKTRIGDNCSKKTPFINFSENNSK